MKRYQVRPGTRFEWAHADPDDVSGAAESKLEAKEELAHRLQRLEELQELLFAEHRHKLLVVLQGMDTAGKDGVIRHVFSGVNPQGVRVASFKAPSSTELDHDYLWRVHHEVPGRGEIALFNRSHYEDVLVVRVHGGISAEECERRYRQINEFERMLVEEGVTLLKFYLNVSRGEQKKRLAERLSDPRKHWKFDYGDLRERALWKEYERAYAELLEKTSTEFAPWYVIPANHKGYRNLVVAQLLVSTLEDLQMSYPTPAIDPATIQLD